MRRGSKQMQKLLVRFFKDEAGVTSLEYGIIASLVATAIIVAATNLGTKTGGTMANVKNNLK
jgi:pilus assembly protein Flp/PilA